MSGAMIRSMSWFSSVRSQVGRTPSVVPLLGSVATSGTGMNGAVEGLSQRARPVVCPGAGTGTEGGTGDGGPADSGGGNWARAIDGTAVNSTAATRRHAVNWKSETAFQSACPPVESCRFLTAVTIAEVSRAQRAPRRSEEHTSELQSQSNLVCRLLLEKKKIARAV